MFSPLRIAPKISRDIKHLELGRGLMFYNTTIRLNRPIKISGETH